MTHPPFLFTKPFYRQDGGIASPPSLRTKFFPSLVKGEVLSPEKIRATTGGIVTPPTFFKTALSLAPHHVLASLVKGRWIDGKAQALILLLSVYDTSAFFYLSNFSAVKTEGLSLHQPFQNRTIPPTFRRASVCVCLYGFVSALSLAQHHVLASPRKR